MPANAAELLSRFPGPVTLYPSRAKWLLLFAGGTLFAVGGLWMVLSGRDGGWLVLLFFGLGTLVAAAGLLPGAGMLRLDREGFEVTSLFRRHRILWQDVTRFESGRIPPARQLFVLYDSSKPRLSGLESLNTVISGHSAALPDTYELAAGELARLMAQWREQATSPRR